VCPLCAPAVTVNVSRLYPLTVPLTQNGTAVRVDGTPEMLFRPVIHLFGNKNRTLSGEVLKVSHIATPIVDVGTQQPKCLQGRPDARVCLLGQRAHDGAAEPQKHDSANTFLGYAAS
jgi:hypothetical protein